MSSNYYTKSKIFLFILISFIVGIFISDYINMCSSTYFLVISIAFFALTISFAFKNKTISTLIACILMLVLGSFYLYDYKSKFNTTHLPYNQMVEFEGVVDDYPDIRTDVVKYTIRVSDSDQKNIIGQKILIDAPKYPQFNYSDELNIKGFLEEPGSWDNFDYKRYLSKDKISSIIRNNIYKNKTEIKFIKKEKPNIFYEYVFRIRTKLQKIVNQIFIEPEAGIISAITLGNKRNISDNLSDILAIVGLSHIIVISGFHVTTLILIYKKLTTSLPKILVFLLGTLMLIFFVVLTGASASVIRASLMAWLFLLAPIVGRKGHMVNVFVFAIFLMILQNPIILRADMGFQLSVASVFGLIYFSPYFTNLFKRLGEIISVSLGATISAQITTLPLVVYYFSRASLVAPISNVLVVPTLPFIIPGAMCSILIGLINIKLAWIVSMPVWLISRYVVFIAQTLSRFKFASVNINIEHNLYIGIIIFYYLIAGYFAYKINKNNVEKL